MKDWMMVILQQPLDDYLIEEEVNFVSVAGCFAVDFVELVGQPIGNFKNKTIRVEYIQ